MAQHFADAPLARGIALQGIGIGNLVQGVDSCADLRGQGAQRVALGHHLDAAPVVRIEFAGSRLGNQKVGHTLYVTLRNSHTMNGETAGEKFQRLVGIMARLRGPGGCPWDREQTFDSIKPYTLEETYEVLQAIDDRDWDGLAEELGDFLLQAVFYAQMASEQNLDRKSVV